MVVITVVVAWCLLSVPLGLVVGRTIRDDSSAAEWTADGPVGAEAATTTVADGPHPRLAS